MFDLLIPYFLSLLVSIIAIVCGSAAYLYYRSVALQHERQRRLLPEATEWDDLQAKLQVLRLEHSRLNSEATEARMLFQQRKSAEEWLKQNAERHQRLQEELPRLLSREEALLAAISKAEAARLDLSRQQEVLSASVAVKSAKDVELSKSIESAVVELDRFHSRLTERSEQEAELSVRVAENKARLDETRMSLEKLAASHRELTARFQEDQKQAGTLRAEVLENLQRESELVRRCQVLNSEATVLAQRLELLKEAVEQVKLQETSLKPAVLALDEKRRELEEVTRELDELIRASRKDLDNEMRELDKVRAEHERRQSEIQEMQTHYNALQQRIAESAKLVPIANETDEEKLAELWSPVLHDLSAAAEHEVKDEVTALRQTSDYLKSLGLHFPERALKAFHTTLKVADISPLVVLAGISGTGKSLLPRRYAEAMGIHFLNIAVQPRWDSPQDMFGFYNYLENRYRSTELARALIQMDPFASESGRGWRHPKGWEKNSRSGQMLIVLLDEMNLARVEYYFSEFLSRLETRRGIDVNREADRRKAEIMLEVGMARNNPTASAASSNGEVSEPTMRVFVDRNVLFVGTMNEDESTQSLSDKVVDRANVIRFGKPHQLSQGGSLTAGKPNAYLSYRRWQSWTRSAEAIPAEMYQAIERLNHAMTMIRRPFAYRTAQAISSYIANYPEPDEYRNALSDQIEFKILPRFRGVDLSDGRNKQALHDIRTLVEKDLDDEALAAAIEECERQGMSDNQFAWHGLDRGQNT